MKSRLGSFVGLVPAILWTALSAGLPAAARASTADSGRMTVATQRRTAKLAGTSASDTSQLVLRLGPAFQSHSDLLASPFHQHGSGISGGIAYRRGGLTLALSAGTASTSSRLEGSGTQLGLPGEGGEDVWAGNLEVRYLRKVADPWGATVWLGGSLSAVASVRRHTYAGGSREFFADMAVPLSLAVGVEIRPSERTSVSSSADVSLATVFFRSPFAGTKTFPDPILTGPWQAGVLYHRLRVSRRISTRFSLGISHGLSLLTSSLHRPLRVVRQDVSIEVGLVTGGSS